MAELKLDDSRGTVMKFGGFCIANKDDLLSHFEQNLNLYSNSSTRPEFEEVKRLDRTPIQIKSSHESHDLQYQEERDGQTRKNHETVSTEGENRNMSFSKFSKNSEV
jgi:hypothetical protein